MVGHGAGSSSTASVEGYRAEQLAPRHAEEEEPPAPKGPFAVAAEVASLSVDAASVLSADDAGPAVRAGASMTEDVFPERHGLLDEKWH